MPGNAASTMGFPPDLVRGWLPPTMLRLGTPLHIKKLVSAFAAEYLSNEDLSVRLGFAIGTVEKYLAEAYLRFEVANRTELAALIAFHQGVAWAQDRWGQGGYGGHT